MLPDDDVKKQNDALTLQQARSKIYEGLQKRLNAIDLELDKFDRYAIANQGTVASPPVVGRTAEEVLLDKATTEAALAIAKERADLAKANLDELMAPKVMAERKQ